MRRARTIVALAALAGWSLAWTHTEEAEVPQPEQDQTRTVQAVFDNALFNGSPPADAVVGRSAVFYSGSVDSPASAPSGGGRSLVQASFGQPWARQVPEASFESRAVERAGALLYYGQAPAGEENLAAYRYKDLLYRRLDAQDPASDVVNILEIRSQGHTIDELGLYGPAERARSLDAERILRNALKYAPWSTTLRRAMLDLYYDRAGIELALARERAVEAARRRFVPSPPGQVIPGVTLNAEIAALEQTIGTVAAPGGFRFALKGYFELLTDPLGVDSGAFDSAFSGTPFGCYMFAHEQPSRDLFAGSHIENGEPVPVIGYCGGSPGAMCDSHSDCGAGGTCHPASLSSGYKDLIMIFGLMRDYSDTVIDLARLKTARGLPQDRDDALQLVSETHQTLFLDGQLLLALFPAAVVQGTGTDLPAAVAGWQVGLSRLNEVKSIIDGDENILGFADDFLMLVREGFADSYDWLDATISNPSTGALPRAIAAFGAADAAYDLYQGTLDQLATNFSAQNERYESRICEIVGSDDQGQCPARGTEPYNTPHDNPGGLIEQQYRSIEIARKQIELNSVQMKNLFEQIQIEIDSRAAIRQLENAIRDVYIDYGSQQVPLTQKIGSIQSNQSNWLTYSKIAGSLGTMVTGIVIKNPSLIVGGAAGLQDGVAQAIDQHDAAERQQRVAFLQAAKEQLAALERAEIQDGQSEILDIQSEARIKAWLLQAAEIDVRSGEAALLVDQEISRLVSLYNEVIDLERRMDQANVNLGQRYYADPIHRLRAQSTMAEADLSFQTAQKWVYFLMRALEHKWNIATSELNGGLGIEFEGDYYSVKSVLQARSAEELDRIADALRDYDGRASTNQPSPHLSWFSVRSDFFGYDTRTCDGECECARDPLNPATIYAPKLCKDYEDPITGERTHALQAFRSALSQLIVDDPDSPQSPPPQVLLLDFSTARDMSLGAPSGDSFPLFGSNTWNDKIEWIKVAIPGTHSTTTVVGEIQYGGTAFVRNQNYGTVNPQNPEEVVNEMRAYSTRYWYYDTQHDRWAFSGSQKAVVQVLLSENPEFSDVPDVWHVPDFAERSVAATGWRLKLPVNGLNIDAVTDIRFYIKHWSIARQ